MEAFFVAMGFIACIVLGAAALLGIFGGIRYFFNS